MSKKTLPPTQKNPWGHHLGCTCNTCAGCQRKLDLANLPTLKRDMESLKRDKSTLERQVLTLSEQLQQAQDGTGVLQRTLNESRKINQEHEKSISGFILATRQRFGVMPENTTFAMAREKWAAAFNSEFNRAQKEIDTAETLRRQVLDLSGQLASAQTAISELETSRDAIKVERNFLRHEALEAKETLAETTQKWQEAHARAVKLADELSHQKVVIAHWREQAGVRQFLFALLFMLFVLGVGGLFARFVGGAK